MCCFFVSLLSLFFPCSPPPFPWSSVLSRTGRKESQEASNLAVPMTMCLFPVPFPLTPSLRPQVSSINPTVTRSLLYSVLRDAPADRGAAPQQSREVQLSEYPSLDYQGLYATLVTLLDLVPMLQHGQHGESTAACCPCSSTLSVRLHSSSLCDCLSFFSIRSGTGHILHYNLPSAFPQWWYSQYFALHHDLYFSHLPSVPAQRYHRVPEHILHPHGHTWVKSSVFQR